MERKQFSKDILEICKDGKFNRVLKLVNNSHIEVDNKCALSLIVSCCNACVNSSPENILEDDLYELLKFAISRVECLNESELLNYLRSIYFFLRTLGVKKRYDVIVKMQSMVIPSFLPPNLSSKHKDTYQSCGGLLHNFVISLGTEKNSRHNEALIGICYMVSNIYSKVSILSSLVSTSSNCGSTICCLGVSTKMQEEYYFHVVDLLLKEELKSISREDFKCLVKYLMLLYNNILQKANFESAAKFYKKAFMRTSQVFLEKIYFHILTLLKFPLVLSPAKMESFSECKKSLQELDNSSSELLGSGLNALIYTVVSYYKTVDSQIWKEFPQTFQLELLHFIYDVGQFEVHKQFLCPCKCGIKKNIYQTFTYLQYICTLLEVSVSSQSEVAHDYHEKCSDLLVKFSAEVQTLKDLNCEKWKSAWNMLGVGIYNIGFRLYQKSSKASLLYFYKLVKYFIKFEGNEGKARIVKFSLISSAFTAICNLNAGNLKSCLVYTALAIVFCHDEREYLMAHWMKAKVKLRDLKPPDSEELQMVTLVSAFDKLQEQMILLTDTLPSLTIANKVDLLIFELEQYKKKFKSRIPMMSALKELYNIADLNTTVQVLVRVFGSCDLALHEEVPKLIHKIIKRYEAIEDENRHSEFTVFLAVLYHLHYKYCVKGTISKNIDEMEHTRIMVQETSEPPDAIPKDPNEACDIISSYECLKLDRYFFVMKYLDKSLSLFATVINNTFDPSCFETVKMSTVYDLLLKIFYEYRLHKHRVRGIQALQLAVKVAQVEKEPAMIIETIGFIIENADITKNYVNSLISMADKQLANMQCADLGNLKIILTYYICKAKAYLYQDYMEAHRIFQTARDLYEKQDDKSQLLIIRCQLLLLHYKFVMLPCELGIEDHQKSTLLTIHAANQTIYEAYNTLKLDGSYEMSILLDANEDLTKLYHSLRSPREVRAYCSETIILTQKLVLPLRCASYLIYLAHADLRSSRYDDSQIKLSGLADILNLSKCSLQINRENKLSSETNLEKEIDGIANGMQEMVLDLPISNVYKKQYCPSSPNLVIQPFHVPGFVNHNNSCDCFYCICFEYQENVLYKSRLDAFYNVKRGNSTIAMDFFCNALELYERCRRKSESYTEKVGKLISNDLIPSLEKELLESYGFILLDYSYHIARTKNTVDALYISNKLIDMVTSRKLELPHLYYEALTQKLGYLHMLVNAAPAATTTTKIDDEETLDMDMLDLPKADYSSTTPESKQSRVTVKVTPTPPFSPLKRRLKKKCLPFDLSPTQDNESNQMIKKNPPISKNLLKTPVPKIKVYTTDDDNMVKAKSPEGHVKVQASTKKKKVKTRQNIMDIGFIVPETASTPAVTCPINAESGLKSRTKMLTERLRQSTKTSKTNAAPAEETLNSNGNGKKISARKNLLSELSNSESQQSGAHGGAIRKSTRIKK